MKFGRNLPRNQVPEWASSYINYKALKKLIKLAVEVTKHGEDADLAGFLYYLDRNLEDVNNFYNKKHGEAIRRLKLLDDRYGHSVDVPNSIDADDVEDLMAALLELRGQLRKLQWYGEVNRRGFVKITKKLDKKVAGSRAQKSYLESKVDPSPFATNAKLLESMRRINDWLSMLGDAKVQDDASSSHSSFSIGRVSSKSVLNLPPTLLVAIDQAIRNDDSHTLLELLEKVRVKTEDMTEYLMQKLLMNALQRSITYRARACLAAMLGVVTSLEEDDDINKRNCIHRLVISIGRSQSTADSEQSADMILDYPVDTSNFITPATAPTLEPRRAVPSEANQSQLLSRDDPSVSLLAYLLDKLHPDQWSALLAKDMSGRTPLHFAAQYGFRVVCRVIIEHLQVWNMFDVEEGIDAPSWQDNEGWAPLHLSVIAGHPLTTQTLLDAENWKGTLPEKMAIRRNVAKSSAVLALATKANYIEIVKLLVEARVDINFQDEQGETALHVAARFGHDECARVLLEGSKDRKADTELFENTYSWTPLFTACVDGNYGVMQLLIDAGADPERFDSSGWTAKEHASLRGHITIARRLAEVTAVPETLDSEASSVPSTSPPTSHSLAHSKSNGLLNGTKTPRPTETVKTFGHRYLTDDSMILVSLGTMDMRKTVKAVNLERIPLANAHSTQLDTALSLVVSASGAKGEPEIIDLPVQDNMSTEPIVFHAMDATKVKLLFDLIPTYAGSKDQVVGRGVALLSSIKPSVGSNRITLQGDSTVPIVAANTLEVIGSVTFNFLIITPFKHPNMSVTENQTYWKSMTSSTMLIGHRGLGKNFAGRKSLQLGENTIQSFIAAANLGASYVEFDVQLTKDHVPVIYHDFLVSETGIDAPVHTLTLEQFLYVSEVRTPRDSRPSSPVQTMDPKLRELRASGLGRNRSMSAGTSEYDNNELSERMKHTRDFKIKGFKGNSRGNHIQERFTTLEQMFKKIPQSTGFNIEMKYPMLHESEEEEMDTYAVELNSFVDTVLTKVYELGKGRNMIFSSFNPNICLLLSFKQPSIPILFLTDAGASPVGDIRASSLQEAIRFASRWNLLGVVSAAEPLVISPRLVKVVKESGLVCVSYGVLNNDPLKVNLQVKEGIDAVIVDSVLAIRQGLQGSEQKPSPQTEVMHPSPLPQSKAALSQLELPRMGVGYEATAAADVEKLVQANGNGHTGNGPLKPMPVEGRPVVPSVGGF